MAVACSPVASASASPATRERRVELAASRLCGRQRIERRGVLAPGGLDDTRASARAASGRRTSADGCVARSQAIGVERADKLRLQPQGLVHFGERAVRLACTGEEQPEIGARLDVARVRRHRRLQRLACGVRCGPERIDRAPRLLSAAE